ncbi:MAG: discoidin domain-containing protein, partial [Verrucomicrobiota bacterium]
MTVSKPTLSWCYVSPLSRFAICAAALAFSSAAYSQSTRTPGKWQRQLWTGITGSTVSKLTSSPNFNLAPNSTALTDASYASLGSSYGARTRGYITPATTGLYTFWVAGDDETQLFMAGDESKWAASKIAGSPLLTQSNDWDQNYLQRSAPRYLIEGQTYYIEMLHKQKTGSDHASVAFAMQGVDSAGLQNWASATKGAVAYASGNFQNAFPPSNGMDGNTATYFCTDIDVNAWWMVDFRQDRLISSVNLVNRQDDFQTRLSNFRVTVEDVNGVIVASKDFYEAEGSVGSSETWELPTMVAGRRVKVQFLGLNRDETNYLHLGEVEVFGPDTSVRNWAHESGAVATESTNHTNQYPASNAIDGSINTISHTSNLANSWWQVDLGADRLIDSVELVNRQVNGINRLSNFRISVLDSADQVLTSRDYYTASGNVLAALRWELPTAVTGRKIKVSMLGLNRDGNYYLHMSEVNVWGRTDSGISDRGLRGVVPAGVMSSYAADLTDDADDDGLLDAWESLYGFAVGHETGDKSMFADPDGDLRDNLTESLQGTNPFVAEGELGHLSQSIWTSMSYDSLQQTRKDVRYFQAPQSTSLPVGSIITNLSGDTAGRIRGYVTPPETGYYRFWISSGISSELWLSSVEDDKYQKQYLCGLSPELGSGHKGITQNSSALWDSYAFQMSREVYLEAGKPYFMEADYQLYYNPHVSIAWAKRGCARQVIPESCLRSYIPTPDDIDDDFLPDAWETQYGLSTTDAGGFDNAREGEFGDFDGDGLTNLEEYILNTNPANADTDGDGISDNDEVNALGTNALVANAINDTLVGEVDLGASIASSTSWTMTSGGLLANSFRGESTWNFTVPSGGNWLLWLNAELMGTSYGNEKVPMVVSVDGQTIARRNVQFGSCKVAILQALTPYLAAGSHQVTILVDNMFARRTVRLVSLKIYAPANAAALLAQGNSVFSHSPTTRTSPAFIEGCARNATNTTVNGNPVIVGINDTHWFSNIPLLSQDDPQAYALQLEQGCGTNGFLTWQSTNTLDGETLLIRQGDSLRVGAWNTDPTMTATLHSSAGGTWTLTGNQSIPI